MTINQTNLFKNSFLTLKNSIDTISQEMSNGGLSDTVQNRIDFLAYNNSSAIKSREIKAIDTSIYYHSQTDNTLSSITEQLNNYKILTQKKLNASQTTESIKNIDLELNNVTTTISNLLNTKLDGEDLFSDGQSNVVIGDGITVPRNMTKDWLKTNNKTIVEQLNAITIQSSPNLDDIDIIMNTVLLKQTEIGARQKSLENTKEFYSDIQLNEDSKIANLYDLTGTIIKLHNVNTTYQSLAKAYSIVSELSLTKYI